MVVGVLVAVVVVVDGVCVAQGEKGEQSPQAIRSKRARCEPSGRRGRRAITFARASWKHACAHTSHGNGKSAQIYTPQKFGCRCTASLFKPSLPKMPSRTPFLAALPAARRSSMVPSAVIRHVASRIKERRTSSLFFGASLVMQSATW